MGTRSFAQVAPTSATIALNAYIFGYGGHSLVTPHVALKQLWWTEERIKAKVTRNFVVSKLRVSQEREFLDKPLAFGEGLTDDTYMEWILERARRFFLILAEIGVPDQIFGCIDDSWDDNDLPIPLEIIPGLELAYENDDTLNKKFYDTQFLYLLRELQPGSHIDYGPREHIPMEHVNTMPPAVSLQIWDRVHFPGKPDEIYMRRKYPLTDRESGSDQRESFLRDVSKAQRLPHEHIARVWASYTTEDSGYVLSNFVGEHTLATFIDHRMPSQFQRVPAWERPALLCEWMHCLSDALASLHFRGAAHTAIRPSNIIIDRSNHIAFSDIGSIRTFQRGKKANKVEIYDYAAPESQQSSPSVFISSPPLSSAGVFYKLRKLSSSTISSSGSSSLSSSTRSNSLSNITTTPSTPASIERSNSTSTVTTTISPAQKPPANYRNFSRHLTHQTSLSYSEDPSSPTSTNIAFPLAKLPDPRSLCELPGSTPQMLDIYSLACVFLDIITFLVKGKTNDFVKHRTTRSTSTNNKRVRNDTSFHSDPDKIISWMTILSDDSERRTEKIFRGVPELLRLIRRMLMQNATLRPTALEVRDQIKTILTDVCGIEKLCCADRIWDLPPLTKSSTWSSADFSTRDSMSIATGMTPLSPTTTQSERGTSLSQGCDEGVVLARTESNVSSTHGSRKSSGSNSTARVSSWRRAFSRSS